jgi:hypothetical protein
MIIPSRKGLIALDIDGTVTADKHSIPREVVDYLVHLEKQGWALIFITGRPFNWAYQTLQQLKFPFLFAVQNGALLLELPSKKILHSHYLSIDCIPLLESICKQVKTDFVIYSGYENDDLCYYRKGYFSSEMFDYLMLRKKALVETWLEISSFDRLPVQQFTALKCFGNEEQAEQLSIEIERQLGLHSPQIRDPFDENNYIIQATHPLASKGKVLQEILTNSGFTGPVIAAGDDNNDYGMLQVAHVKIAMANAPPKLLAIADIISPPATQKGIIQGLSQALEKIGKR